MKVLNSFSINMLGSMEAGLVEMKKISREKAAELFHHEEIESCIGHADTARLVGGELGIELPASRVSVALEKEEVVVVAQYTGPRLPEGCTSLPQGAKISYWTVRIKALESDM